MAGVCVVGVGVGVCVCTKAIFLCVVQRRERRRERLCFRSCLLLDLLSDFHRTLKLLLRLVVSS